MTMTIRKITNKDYIIERVGDCPERAIAEAAVYPARLAYLRKIKSISDSRVYCGDIHHISLMLQAARK